jgi:hypothetical protein
MGAADCSRTRLGKTEVQNLSFFNELFNRTSHMFDWHIWIDPVLVEKVNAVRFKPLE